MVPKIGCSYKRCAIGLCHIMLIYGNFANGLCSKWRNNKKEQNANMNMYVLISWNIQKEKIMNYRLR